MATSQKAPIAYSTSLLMLFVLLIALAPGYTNGATVSLALYSQVWPDVPYSTILLLGTLPMLCLTPASLCFSPIVGRIGYRKTALLGFGIILVSGMAPCFVESFYAVLAMRAITGFGLGLVGPMYTSLVMAYFADKPGIRSKGVGWTQTMVTASGIIFSILGGWLAGFGTWATWLGVLLLAPVFIACMFLPEPAQVLTADGDADDAKAYAEKTDSLSGKTAVKEKISWRTWLLFALYFIIMMINISFLVNSSFIVESMGYTPIESGVVMSLSSAGGGVSAFLFGFLFKGCKDRTFALGLLLTAVFAVMLVTIDKSLVALYTFSFLIAFGRNMVICYCMYAINVTAPQSRTPFINGIMGFMGGAAYFLSGYWNTLFATLFGQQDNFFFPLTVMTVVFFILGIIWLIKPVVRTADSPKATAYAGSSGDPAESQL